MHRMTRCKGGEGFCTFYVYNYSIPLETRIPEWSLHPLYTQLIICFSWWGLRASCRDRLRGPIPYKAGIRPLVLWNLPFGKSTSWILDRHHLSCLFSAYWIPSSFNSPFQVEIFSSLHLYYKLPKVPGWLLWGEGILNKIFPLSNPER